MTDEELDAIEGRVRDDHRKGTMMFADDALALIVEVRRLREVLNHEFGERVDAARRLAWPFPPNPPLVAPA